MRLEKSPGEARYGGPPRFRASLCRPTRNRRRVATRLVLYADALRSKDSLAQP